MKVETRLFDTIEIDDDKIIHFSGGIVGFPDLTDFALVHDEEKGPNAIRWMQSLQETGFAMPVIDPLLVLPEYNPVVEDELLKALGDIKEDNTLVLVTITVPSDITKMTVNLRGPIVINAKERKACQVILEGEQYLVKFPIYEILKSKKGGE